MGFCDCSATKQFRQNAKYTITIQQKNSTQDNLNSPTVNWTTVGTYRAWIKPLTIREDNAQEQLQSRVANRFVIRFISALRDTKVTGTYRITFDGRVYDVIGIKNLDRDLKTYGRLFQEISAVDNGAELQ